MSERLKPAYTAPDGYELVQGPHPTDTHGDLIEKIQLATTAPVEVRFLDEAKEWFVILVPKMPKV
jgi:hypothetical protein